MRLQMDRKLIYDVTEFKYSRDIVKRLPYPFFSLNKITGGAEIGNLVILFAKSNQGKSELCMQFISFWVSINEKVVAMLGEHTMRKAQGLLYKKVSKYDKDKWITKSYGKDADGKDWGIYETFISEEDEAKAINIFKGKLFLYDTRNGFDLNTIIKAFEEGKKKGCSIAILDNQMMIDLDSNNELREQTDNTEKLRQWAKQNQMVIFLIAHSRKVETDRIRLTETDIAGSSNISNKATTIMTLVRTNTLDPNSKEYKYYSKLLEYNYIDIKKCDAILEVVKEKNGIGVGFVPLKWYNSTKTFREVYDPEVIQKREGDKRERELRYQNGDDGQEEKPTLFINQSEMQELSSAELSKVDKIFGDTPKSESVGFDDGTLPY